MSVTNMGGWCDTCFCFRDVQRSITAIGIFSLMTSAVQILVAIAVYTGVNEWQELVLTGDEKEHVTYRLYIALAAFDFVIIIFAIVMLYGNERTDEVQARKFLMPWMLIIPFYIMYESAINIYYFYHQFNNKYMEPLGKGHPLGFTVVPLVYWIIKDVFLFISFVFTVMRVRSLTPITEYVEECGCNATPAISLPAATSFQAGPGCGCHSAHKAGWSNSVYHHGR